VGFYEKDFIDEVRYMNDLVDVMREHGELLIHRSGKNVQWLCKCPGRKERNKARVNTQVQLYHCYSCGRSGNVINYIRQERNMTFPEAIEFLANRAGIPLPNDQEAIQAFRARTQAYGDAMKFYKGFRHPYFEKRGLEEGDIVHFGAGYAPGGTKLRDHMLSLGYTLEFLKDIELVNSKDRDTFFHRIVFPIIKNGKVVSMYGRRVDDAENNKHHYINGAKICFGIDEVAQGSVVVVVESILNATALSKQLRQHQDVVSKYFTRPVSVVAIGGCTKFSHFHVNLLKKKECPLVFVCYDPDSSGAGPEEALYTGKMLVENELTTRIMALPEDVDVSDFFVKEKRELSDFLDIMSKAQNVQEYEYVQWLGKIPDEFLKNYIESKFEKGEV